jgi:hypothetical protein
MVFMAFLPKLFQRLIKAGSIEDLGFIRPGFLSLSGFASHGLRGISRHPVALAFRPSMPKSGITGGIVIMG